MTALEVYREFLFFFDSRHSLLTKINFQRIKENIFAMDWSDYQEITFGISINDEANTADITISSPNKDDIYMVTEYEENIKIFESFVKNYEDILYYCITSLDNILINSRKFPVKKFQDFIIKNKVYDYSMQDLTILFNIKENECIIEITILKPLENETVIFSFGYLD